MLDLKGHDRRLPDRVLGALETGGTLGRVTVCSQDWALLEPFARQPGVRVVHSVGNARQLERLRRRHASGLAGISIHRRRSLAWRNVIAAGYPPRGCRCSGWRAPTRWASP
jgi:glycerophosphoryl diester phosphodiesterase